MGTVAVSMPAEAEGAELVRVLCPHCRRLLFYAEAPRLDKPPVAIEYKCQGAGCRRVLRLLVPPPIE